MPLGSWHDFRTIVQCRESLSGQCQFTLCPFTCSYSDTRNLWERERERERTTETQLLQGDISDRCVLRELTDPKKNWKRTSFHMVSTFILFKLHWVAQSRLRLVGIRSTIVAWLVARVDQRRPTNHAAKTRGSRTTYIVQDVATACCNIKTGVPSVLGTRENWIQKWDDLRGSDI